MIGKAEEQEEGPLRAFRREEAHPGTIENNVVEVVLRTGGRGHPVDGGVKESGRRGWFYGGGRGHPVDGGVKESGRRWCCGRPGTSGRRGSQGVGWGGSAEGGGDIRSTGESRRREVGGGIRWIVRFQLRLDRVESHSAGSERSANGGANGDRIKFWKDDSSPTLPFLYGGFAIRGFGGWGGVGDWRCPLGLVVALTRTVCGAYQFTPPVLTARDVCSTPVRPHASSFSNAEAMRPTLFSNDRSFLRLSSSSRFCRRSE